MRLGQFLLFLAAAVAAGTAYCQLWCLIAFPPTHRMPMPIETSLTWSISAISPWVVGFEIGRRRDQLTTTGVGRSAILACAFAGAALLSIVIELGLDRLIGIETTRPVSVQLAAQLPMALLVGGLLMIGSALRTPSWPEEMQSEGTVRQLLDHPADIGWIKAAGNYVEVYRDGRSTLYRATMDRLEKCLDPARFVRIHRSVIINRELISARVVIDGASGVRLRDGSLHKLGGRYARNLTPTDG